MAIDYFGTFPKLNYDMDKDNKTKEVTDILRRVGMRGDFDKLLPSYYKDILASNQRPEIASYLTYGDIFSHWILLHLNRVVDPYHLANVNGEWFLFAHCQSCDGDRSFSCVALPSPHSPVPILPIFSNNPTLNFSQKKRVL